jgi:hypothetical protein
MTLRVIVCSQTPNQNQNKNTKTQKTKQKWAADPFFLMKSPKIDEQRTNVKSVTTK